jgi:hypothetical protein
VRPAGGWASPWCSRQGRQGGARAAACYAIPEHSRVYATRVASGHPARVPALWPWEVAGWKPTAGHRRRELVKAAALLLAEIERIDRDVARHGEWVR